MNHQQKQKGLYRKINNFGLRAFMQGDALKIEIQSVDNFEGFFEMSLTPDILKQLPYSYCFDKPSELLDHLMSSPINITNNGVLEFEIELNKKMKKATIETIKKVFEINELIEKLRAQIKNQKFEIEAKNVQNNELTTKNYIINQENISLKAEIKNMKKNQNSINQKQIMEKHENAMKSHCEMNKIEKCKFEIDLNRTQLKQCSESNTTIIKISGNYKTYIYGKQIPQKLIYSYKIINSSISSCVSYGIATPHAYTIWNNELSYYFQDGKISYNSQKIGMGSKIENQKIVEMIVNMKQWKVVWRIDEKQIGSSDIPEKVRSLTIYPVIVLHKIGSSVQFV